ncbi:hypothetical protein CEXT_757121 [Caerostris extrusa]|uniref:Uncharacterized protein n=1 Tax=Caerostris extrusa TaxID=172846 RepID=A0AAV4V826_CAEEX|nr:hypothetical protein CEXT_757121 [Caerostris extrusa]
MISKIRQKLRFQERFLFTVAHIISVSRRSLAPPSVRLMLRKKLSQYQSQKSLFTECNLQQRMTNKGTSWTGLTSAFMLTYHRIPGNKTPSPILLWGGNVIQTAFSTRTVTASPELSTPGPDHLVP